MIALRERLLNSLICAHGPLTGEEGRCGEPVPTFRAYVIASHCFEPGARQMRLELDESPAVSVVPSSTAAAFDFLEELPV
jgi:hypothetical protein